MGLTVLLCPVCGKQEAGGGYYADCPHYLDLVELEVEPAGGMRRLVDEARWQGWQALDWQHLQRRASPPRPYLDPNVDWRPSARRARWKRRHQSRMAVLADEIKAHTDALRRDINRQACGNTFLVPLKAQSSAPMLPSWKPRPAPPPRLHFWREDGIVE